MIKSLDLLKNIMKIALFHGKKLLLYVIILKIIYSPNHQNTEFDDDKVL